MIAQKIIFHLHPVLGRLHHHPPPIDRPQVAVQVDVGGQHLPAVAAQLKAGHRRGEPFRGFSQSADPLNLVRYQVLHGAIRPPGASVAGQVEEGERGALLQVRVQSGEVDAAEEHIQDGGKAN